MKFLPSLSSLALLPLLLTLSSCASSDPANLRQLYNAPLADNGPWHDYERRRQAEAETGVSGGTAPTVVPGAAGRPTAPPPSSSLPAGTSPAPTGAPAPIQGTDSTAGAPPAPVNPPTPGPVATPAPDAAAPVPDVAAPAPTPAAP